MEMRYRVGDKALDIAKNIEGLVIDENNGRVMQISTDPAKVIALLIGQYEKSLGQKISFALKRGGERTGNVQNISNPNLVVINKENQQ